MIFEKDLREWGWTFSLLFTAEFLRLLSSDNEFTMYVIDV